MKTHDSLHNRTRSTLGRIAVAALLASAFIVIPTSAANAVVVYPTHTWTEYGITAKVNGDAKIAFFLCGVIQCSDTDSVYGRVGRVSGATNNLARVKVSTTLDGIGNVVTVSTSAVGLGFTATSATCSMGYWTGAAKATYVSVSFGTQEICHTSSAVYLAWPTYTVTGGVRVGSSWTARSATATK